MACMAARRISVYTCILVLHGSTCVRLSIYLFFFYVFFLSNGSIGWGHFSLGE